ncbi:MAG: hypothetical protein QOK15_3629 [Nocardioidaceae bacterium]|jgi:hypothetical protein|nr:hypothetical protein [Nocardioidaceae bacterium]
MAIVPDDKDWTWVLERPCPECGFDAAELDPTTVGRRLRQAAADFRDALARADATRRPSAQVWSPTEYGCHVRDVNRVFATRVELMLDEDDPQFENWDQDRTAVEERYGEQDPVEVADQLVRSTAAVADVYDAVPDDAWSRSGRRSNGSAFTVGTLAKYHLHDVVHHLHDVAAGSTPHPDGA